MHVAKTNFDFVASAIFSALEDSDSEQQRPVRPTSLVALVGSSSFAFYAKCWPSGRLLRCLRAWPRTSSGHRKRSTPATREALAVGTEPSGRRGPLRTGTDASGPGGASKPPFQSSKVLAEVVQGLSSEQPSFALELVAQAQLLGSCIAGCLKSLNRFKRSFLAPGLRRLSTDPLRAPNRGVSQRTF